MRRRQVIGLLGGAAVAWPRVIGAQQSSMPVIGYLSTLSEAQVRGSVDAFRRGLGETGFIEGRNIIVEYRYAEGQYERLPALAAELVEIGRASCRERVWSSGVAGG